MLLAVLMFQCICVVVVWWNVASVCVCVSSVVARTCLRVWHGIGFVVFSVLFAFAHVVVCVWAHVNFVA